MKNTQSILGLPETGISSALAVQLASSLGFMTDVYGLSCTSCALDEQAGYEKMINALLPSMAGATMITGIVEVLPQCNVLLSEPIGLR